MIRKAQLIQYVMSSEFLSEQLALLFLTSVAVAVVGSGYSAYTSMSAYITQVEGHQILGSFFDTVGYAEIYGLDAWVRPPAGLESMNSTAGSLTVLVNGTAYREYYGFEIRVYWVTGADCIIVRGSKGNVDLLAIQGKCYWPQ